MLSVSRGLQQLIVYISANFVPTFPVLSAIPFSSAFKSFVGQVLEQGLHWGFKPDPALGFGSGRAMKKAGWAIEIHVGIRTLRDPIRP